MENRIEKICSTIGYEYVGGYTGSNGNVSLKCPKCQAIFVRTWRAVRKIASGYQKTFVCESCEEIKKIKRQEEQNAKYIANIERREKKKESKFWKQSFDQITFTFCVNCGKPICGRKFCSKDCCKAYNNRRKKDRRLRKVKTVKHIYIDIRELYIRDKGICHLCGRICDFEDSYTREDGAFIAGNNYPSIDHVKPLSKGGEHSWDNVKLAHRICNTMKRDKVG